MQDPAEEGSNARDPAAQIRIAATRELTRVREALREGHADARSDRGGEACKEGVMRLVSGERDGEDRRQRRERSVDQADHRRLDTLEQEDVFVRHGYSVSDE